MFLLVSVITLWLLCMSFVIVLTQRSPGRAVWDVGNEQEWSGVLIGSPYPILIPDQPEEAALLVVGMGKFGAQDALTDAFNHRVTLRGFELWRDGRHLIELTPEPDAVVIEEAVDNNEIPTLQLIEEELIDLVGEITDGKCYLGAMKPGDGYGHRSCAALCLHGGLPPMFVAESDVGGILYPLLIVDGSSTLDADVISLVASRVRVRGQRGTIAGLPVITTHKRDIELMSSELTAYMPSQP